MSKRNDGTGGAIAGALTGLAASGGNPLVALIGAIIGGAATQDKGPCECKKCSDKRSSEVIHYNIGGGHWERGNRR